MTYCRPIRSAAVSGSTGHASRDLPRGARIYSARARIAQMSAAPLSSVLSDGTIARLVGEGRIRIDPWDEGLIQPASGNLRLGDSFRVFHNHKITAIDLREPPRALTEQVTPPPGEPFVIHPGEFCLGRTLGHG